MIQSVRFFIELQIKMKATRIFLVFSHRGKSCLSSLIIGLQLLLPLYCSLLTSHDVSIGIPLGDGTPSEEIKSVDYVGEIQIEFFVLI